MINVNVKVVSQMNQVLTKSRAAETKNLGLTGGLIRKFAMQSIKISHWPSSPGNPPHSRRGLLKKSIVYAVQKEEQNVLVGPTANVIGPAGKPHEHGGEFRGQKYPMRPFMGPAQRQAGHALDKIWANSVK